MSLSALTRLNVGQRVHNETTLMVTEWNKLSSKIDKSTFSNDLGETISHDEIAHPLRTLQLKHTATGFFLSHIVDYYSQAGLQKFGQLPETFLVDLECFFYFAWGILDSTGLLLTNSLKLPLAGRHVSFIGAIDYLCGNNSPIQDPLFAGIKSDLQSGWLDKLGNYRDFVTHKGLLLTQAGLVWKGGKTAKIQICLLPDDPLATTRSYNDQLEAKNYAEDSLVKVTILVKDILILLLNRVFSNL